MLALLLLQRFALAACSGEVTLADLSASLRSAEEAFAEQDAAAFYQATTAARDGMPCLRQPMTPGVAAAWHRNAALERSVNPKAEDRPVVLAALRSMAAADPGYQFPPTLAPAGSVLPALLAAAQAQEKPERAWVTVPERTILLFDGVAVGERAGSLPVVVQVVWLDDLKVHATIPLGLGQPMPNLAQLGVLPPVRLPEVAVEPTGLGRPATLALAGGATALTLVTGVALGLGEANRGTFLDDDTQPSTLPGTVDRSHALSFVALGAGLGAVGLGAVVVISGRL